MERDLFEPIKSYFESFGYVGDGEIGDIDLYLENEDKKVAIELKETLDFRAVQQAALRQKVVDTVFIGIFRPKDMYSQSFTDKIYLLNRLGIGLITVSRRTHSIQIVCEPVVSELSSYQAHNKRGQVSLASEFQRRRLKSNVGGVNRAKLITGYREEALMVLSAMNKLESESSTVGDSPTPIGISTSEIRKLTGLPNTTSILYNNYYNWFIKSGRGIYALSNEGRAALVEYSEEIKRLCPNLSGEFA